MPNNRNRWKISSGVLILVLISVVFYILGKRIPQEVIVGYVAGAGPFAPIAFILLYLVNIIIAPINGFPFLIAAFYLFGKTSVLYVYFASIIGYTINFLIARKWGRPIVLRLAGKEAISKIDNIEREYGAGTLFMMRLFLIGLGDFISYGYGLTPIKISTYLLITYFAIIPSHIIWYFVVSRTSGVEQFLGVNVILTFGATGVYIAGHYLVKRFRQV